MIAFNQSENIYIKKLTFLINTIFFNKNNDFAKNEFFTYFLFIYDYINKTNYIPILIQIFLMEFVREYLLRTSRLKLFEIKEESVENNDFYIILFFVSIRILNNIYIKYKYNFDRKYEHIIKNAFNKNIFIQRCKIPFHIRQKLNMTKFEELQNIVSSNIDHMINNIFESYVNIITNLILSFCTFYKHNMMTHYFVMIISLYFIFKNVLYPMRKAQMKMRVSNRKVFNKMYNEISLLEFNFTPFLEHMHIYDKIQNKELEIHNIRTFMKNMSKNIFSIVHYCSDFFLIIILFNNYYCGLRNYYIIVTTLSSLFDVSKTLLNNISDIEEAVEHYAEFMTYLKDIPNDSEFVYAKSIDFPLQMNIKIPLYNDYVVNGAIKINRNDKIFITGPSGAGKSTIAKKIAGYDYYESGKPIYRNCVYYLTQDYNESWCNSNYTWNILFPNMKSISELKAYLMHFAFPLSKFSEHSTLENEVPTLSGGEKKRLQYAFLFNRDLINNKEIIILDEPHKDLDEATALEMIQGIGKLFKHKCLIIIKHEKPRICENSRVGDYEKPSIRFGDCEKPSIRFGDSEKPSDLNNWSNWKEIHVNNKGIISML